MSAVSILNPKADVLRKKQSFAAQLMATEGLLSCIASNYGPCGTYVMIVGGAGQIKITKDGNVFLSEVQLNHPTASLVARVSSAQDATVGDGTTSTVIFVGELMRQLEECVIRSGKNPHILCDGLDKAKEFTMEFIQKCSVPMDNISRFNLEAVARSSLCTKVPMSLADQLTDIVVNAVQCIEKPNEQIDLFMVEILTMKQNLITDTSFVKGIVMDHGARHPDMPKHLEHCYILTCNVSLEYEKTEVNSSFFYSSVEERAKLVNSEREFTDMKVRKIIELKNKVCTPENKMSFAVFNQKGIDPPSLDMLAKEGILALRRVKRRNMERLTLCCGGAPVHSVNDLTENDLGFADSIREESIEDEKWTFVEYPRNPKSCTILIKGPNDHSINQVKDAVRDGLRAVKNCIEDKLLLPGAGAFEIATYVELQALAESFGYANKLTSGILAFAKALLKLPYTLFKNAGLDAEICTLKAADHYKATKELVGIDIHTGEPIDPKLQGIWDNYNVRRQSISLAVALTEQILLVDEIIKAGKQMSKGKDM